MNFEEKLKFLKDNGIKEKNLFRKEKGIKNVNYDEEYFCSLVIEDDDFLEKEIGFETILNMIYMLDDVEEFEEFDKDSCEFQGTPEQLSLVLEGDKEKLLSFGYYDIILKTKKGCEGIYFSAKRMETEEEYFKRIDENIKHVISRNKNRGKKEKRNLKKLAKERKLYERLKKKYEPELYSNSDSLEDKSAQIRKTLFDKIIKSRMAKIGEKIES